MVEISSLPIKSTAIMINVKGIYPDFMFENELKVLT